ncbi:MAG TPA: ATP-binding cassette domain-containing protein [Solirubrobacteraceae bacterium]|nr:ATP-binding cassette domain-containing protein [Solirubrobacteraceae bacterium]
MLLRAELAGRVGELELEVSVEVQSGSCLALAGPSAAGKTTILRWIAGIVNPDRGLIACSGELWLDTEQSICRPAEQRRCGLLFQDYALFPHLSAWRNVAYGLRALPRAQRRARALELLERFDIAERAEDRPATLSGGERQRVALARALAPAPEVLLLDEPCAALDVSTRAAATRALAAMLRETGTPVVVVTHDFHEAAVLGDEVAVLDGGKIIQQGCAEDLAARPASAFVADLTGAVVLLGTARLQAGGLTRIELDGGGVLTATDPAEGRVAASVFPWEITLLAPDALAPGSAQNMLPARVTSIVTVGNRARVGLLAAQPMVAEITEESARMLELSVGSRVAAAWKATATRVGEL